MWVGWGCESKGSRNLLRVCLLSHGLHANAPFVGEKDKNLVGWVLIGRRKEVELVPTTNQKRLSSVSISHRERGLNELNATHLICVQLSELREVHFDFFVRDLESLVNKKKRSRVQIAIEFEAYFSCADSVFDQFVDRPVDLPQPSRLFLSHRGPATRPIGEKGVGGRNGRVDLLTTWTSATTNSDAYHE